jgi:hypothetical protein
MSQEDTEMIKIHYNGQWELIEKTDRAERQRKAAELGSTHLEHRPAAETPPTAGKAPNEQPAVPDKPQGAERTIESERPGGRRTLTEHEQRLRDNMARLKAARSAPIKAAVAEGRAAAEAKERAKEAARRAIIIADREKSKEEKKANDTLNKGMIRGYVERAGSRDGDKVPMKATCSHCGETHKVSVDKPDYEHWATSGEDSAIIPYMSRNMKEIAKDGMCATCKDKNESSS